MKKRRKRVKNSAPVAKAMIVHGPRSWQIPKRRKFVESNKKAVDIERSDAGY